MLIPVNKYNCKYMSSKVLYAGKTKLYILLNNNGHITALPLKQCQKIWNNFNKAIKTYSLGTDFTKAYREFIGKYGISIINYSIDEYYEYFLPKLI